VKRIDIYYDGVLHTLPDADLEAVKAQVLNAVTKNEPFWLEVNIGEGSYRRVDLLISPAATITLTGITGNEGPVT
jgi:hypothetical protein